MLQYGEKYEAARQSLPTDLREEFDKLVEHYKYADTITYGHPWVAYKVLLN